MEKINKKNIKEYLFSLLRLSEKYFKTDMVYLAKSGFWINLSYIAGSVFSLVSSIAFAYFVSKETYGIYKYIISTLPNGYYKRNNAGILLKRQERETNINNIT